MGREKDSFIWDQFEQLNGALKCKHCEAEFKGKPSVTRLRKHLQGVKDGGIRICAKVPDNVRGALADGSRKRRRIELGSSCNDVTNSISTCTPQQDDESENPVQEDCVCEGLEAIMKVDIVDELREELDILVSDHANDTMIYGSNNRPQLEPSSSNNEVTNLTSAPQIGESIQDLMVHGSKHDNFNDVHNKEGRIGSVIVEEHGSHYQTRADASLGMKEQLQRKCEELRLCLMEDELMEDDVPETNNGIPFPVTDLVGNSFKKYKDMVWAWLMSGEISSIGIHGMGGVGKTTLVAHIHNRILKNPGIFHVYWVTVTHDFSVDRLQSLIARTIGLDFGDEDDVKKRAAKLSEELRRKHKFVLILDDIWHHFDINEVGIPAKKKGCKLIITTRSLEVCRRTNCQVKLKVEPLLMNEAWELFLETLGHDLAPEVEQIARSIAKECDGLPLGVVTMAGSMRGVDNIHEWTNALTELQNSVVRADDMEPEVFRILRFSYVRLKDPVLQQCLLYCALFPEDFQIKRKELISHLIVEGIIERVNSSKATYDKGYSMLYKLENVCLLECKDDGKSVKMHDLIRDMAIQIMRECSPSLVEVGKHLKRLPKEKCWTEHIVRVSLMKNNIQNITPIRSPRCPKLSTLLLCDNYMLQSIAERFFYKLHGLKVLNLSNTAILKLPESIADLENLTALILKNCKHLRNVPSLKKLGALEVLDLCHCKNVEKVPEGLELLSNLKYLNLLLTGVKELQAEILRNISCLQFLVFVKASGTRGVKGQDLGRLHELETLIWRFHDHGDLSKYIHSFSTMDTGRQQLSQYILFVSPARTYDKHITKFFDGIFDDGKFGRELYFHSCTMGREVFLPEGTQNLDMNSVLFDNGRSLCLKNAIDLKHFQIRRCGQIEYLFCLRSSPSIFQSLETLEVSHMWKLCGLFSRGDYDVPPLMAIATQFPAIGIFTSLKKFKLYRCPRVKKLFPFGLLSNLQNLQELQVVKCSQMEEILASEEEGRNTNCHSIFPHLHFTLPKLKHLELIDLPKLKSICSAKLKFDSLQHIQISSCPKLKKIPISLPISSLEKITICPKECWKSVEWGDPANECDLQPKLILLCRCTRKKNNLTECLDSGYAADLDI